ncbi:DUF2752 domain-containing protein [Actinoplanes couchii]|uniref:DUF2752 domain-containing protein n=1 Tax=Actinoplanes couchii TaxID=403638 RepID=A0ABQ3X9J5_9ACTN|nr:DUF2752 domain-containing protein [Actinoplanes couchii]MDR6325652.1 hypothetical protein [Actinoplanes couchii]GID55179.1 hypothetical protein Aco03nite_035830 [Actinoplanes couchii]
MSTVQLPPWLADQPVQGPPVPPEWFRHPRQQPDRLTRLVNRLADKSPVWLAPLAIMACAGGAVGFTLATDPASAAAGDQPSCLLKYLTGFVCPGCGGTRAAWFLLHGDLTAASRHHLLFVFAVPFLIYLYVAWAGRKVFGWKLPELSISPAVMITFMAVWGVWSILRNLPWTPFTAFYV